MTPPSTPVSIRIPETAGLVFKKGVPLGLSVEVENPRSGSRVILKGVRSLEGSVRVNQDSLQRGVTIEPGERYRFEVLVTQSVYRPVKLDRIRLQFQDQATTLPIGNAEIQTEPSLLREIKPSVETLSSSQLGHRAQVVFRHIGNTDLREVRIELRGHDLVAGKSVLRVPTFVRGNEVSTILLLRNETVTFHVSASSDHGAVREELEGTVEPAPPPTDTGFRLIDPAQLLADDVSMSTEGGKRVPERHSSFVVVSGHQVRLRVRPSNHKAQEVVLTGTAECVHVLKETRGQGAWEYLLRVQRDQVFFPKQAHFFYNVRDEQGARGGEVRLIIRTDWSRRLYTSLAFGIAFTLQGAWGFLRLGQSALVMGDISDIEVATAALETLQRANAWPDESQLYWWVVQLAAIPLIFMGYTLLDEAWYRLLPRIERIHGAYKRWRAASGGSRGAQLQDPS